MCLGCVPHLMGRGRGQTARTGGGSKRFLNASADTLVCSLLEVAPGLQGKMFLKEYVVLQLDFKRDLQVEVCPNLICAALFNHVCFPASKGMKIRRYRLKDRISVCECFAKPPCKHCVAVE